MCFIRIITFKAASVFELFRVCYFIILHKLFRKSTTFESHTKYFFNKNYTFFNQI